MKKEHIFPPEPEAIPLILSALELRLEDIQGLERRDSDEDRRLEFEQVPVRPISGGPPLSLEERRRLADHIFATRLGKLEKYSREVHDFLKQFREVQTNVETLKKINHVRVVELLKNMLLRTGMNLGDIIDIEDRAHVAFYCDDSFLNDMLLRMHVVTEAIGAFGRTNMFIDDVFGEDSIF